MDITSFISIILLIASIVVIFAILKITKTLKMMNEEFQTRNTIELWQYLIKINNNYNKNEETRKKLTKEITEHYSDVEKYRMGKRIAKPL